MSAATLERAPSAPMRYFARMVYSWPLRRLRTRTLTPSASCSWETYSVENCVWVPRLVAFSSRIGSMSVCVRPHGIDGEASS